MKKIREKKQGFVRSIRSFCIIIVSIGISFLSLVTIFAHDEMPPGYEDWGIPEHVEKVYEERIELQDSFEQRPLIESITEASKITGIPEDIVAVSIASKDPISWRKAHAHAENIDTYGPFSFGTQQINYLLKEYPEYFTPVGLWYGEDHHQAVVGQALFLKEKKEALFLEKKELTLEEWRVVIYETRIENFSYYFDQKDSIPGPAAIRFSNEYAGKSIALLQSETGEIELPDGQLYTLQKNDINFTQPHGSTEPVGPLSQGYSLQSILSTDGNNDEPATIYTALHTDRYTVANNNNYEDLHSVVIHAIGPGLFTNVINTSSSSAGAGTGAHFYIRDSDGEITQMGDTKDYVHHAGDPRTDARVNLNKRSIGIEHEGNAGDQDMEYSNTQYKASAKLVRYLSGKYNIPRKYHGKYDETTTTDWWSTVEYPGILGHMQVPGCKYNGGGATCKIDPDGSNFSGQSLWDWPYYISLIEPKHIAVQVNGYDLGDEGNIEFSKFKAEDSETFTFSITNTGRMVTPRTGDAETYSGAITIRAIDTENIKTQTGGEIIISNFPETLLQKGESASFSLVVKNGNSENFFESGSVMFSYTVEGENVPYYFRTSLTPKKIFSPAIISSLKGVKIRKSYSTNAQEEQPTWYTIEERGVTLDFIEKNKTPEQEYDWYEVYWIKGDTQGWSADLGEDRFKVEEYLDRDIGLIGADQKEYRSLFLKEYFKNREKNIQIGDPFDDGSGKYLHEWDGVWLQNFSFGESQESVIMLSEDKTRAYYLPKDIWEVYAKNGPNVIGFPDGSETNGKQSFTKGYIKNGVFSISTEENNTSTPKTFTDLPSSFWGTQYVNYVSNRDIVKGDAGKNTFRPHEGVTRAELLKMAYVSAKGHSLPETRCDTKSAFSDVTQDQWYCGYIQYVEQNGIITVSSEGEVFRPNTPATRGEATYIISKLFRVEKEKNSGTYYQNEKKKLALEPVIITFNDLSYAHKYYADIHWLANVLVPSSEEIWENSRSRIINGYSDKDDITGVVKPTGKFGPDDGITRTEISKIIAGVDLYSQEYFGALGFVVQETTEREVNINGNLSYQSITSSLGNLYEQKFDPMNENAPEKMHLTGSNTKIIDGDGNQVSVEFVNTENTESEENSGTETRLPEKILETQTFPAITSDLNIPLKIKLPVGVTVEIEEGKTLSTKGFVNDVEIFGGGMLEITGDLSVGKIYAPNSIVILNGVNQYFSSQITAKKVVFRNPHSGSNPQKIQKFLGVACEIFGDVEIEEHVRVRNRVGENGSCTIHGNLVNKGRIYVDTGTALVKNEGYDGRDESTFLLALQEVFIPTAYAEETENFLIIFVYGGIINAVTGEMEDITLGFSDAVENLGEIETITPLFVFETAEDREIKISGYEDFGDEENANIQRFSGTAFELPKTIFETGLQMQVREKIGKNDQSDEHSDVFSAWSVPVAIEKEKLKKRVLVQEDAEENTEEFLSQSPVKKSGGGGVSAQEKKHYTQNITNVKTAQSAVNDHKKIFENDAYRGGNDKYDTSVQEAEISDSSHVSQKTKIRKYRKLFSDVPETHPSSRAIEFVQEQGLVKGYTSSTSEIPDYKPENPITRAEFTKILLRAQYSTLEISRKNDEFQKKNENISGKNRRDFSDVKADDWFAAYTIFAKNSGIIQGYEENGQVMFKPENNITFAEAAKIVVNVLLDPLEKSSLDSAREPLQNSEDAEYWYTPFIARLKEEGIDPYAPEKILTRAEMANLIYKILQ